MTFYNHFVPIFRVLGPFLDRMVVLLLILLISKDVEKVPGGVTCSYLGTRVSTNWEFEKAPSGGGRGVLEWLYSRGVLRGFRDC